MLGLLMGATQLTGHLLHQTPADQFDYQACCCFQLIYESVKACSVCDQTPVGFRLWPQAVPRNELSVCNKPSTLQDTVCWVMSRNSHKLSVRSKHPLHAVLPGGIGLHGSSSVTQPLKVLMLQAVSHIRPCVPAVEFLLRNRFCRSKLCELYGLKRFCLKILRLAASLTVHLLSHRLM